MLIAPMSSNSLNQLPRVIGGCCSLRPFDRAVFVVARAHFGPERVVEAFVSSSDQPLLVNKSRLVLIHHAVSASVHPARKPRYAATFKIASKVLQGILLPPIAWPRPLKVDFRVLVVVERLLNEAIDVSQEPAFPTSEAF